MRIKVDSQLKHIWGKATIDIRRRCGERKWANGWRKIPLLYGAIIRLHIRYYCCFMEGFSIYIGTASTEGKNNTNKNVCIADTYN